MSGDFTAAGTAIRFGALEGLANHLGDVPGPIPLVSDETVFGLHGKALLAHLPVEPILLPAGEAAKRWDVLDYLLATLARMDVGRDTPLIALGGGSVGDVAGLAAHLFKRGCPLVQVPTTLLSQVDSAVGGKTAIDFAGAKNLVGAFHPATCAWIDVNLLATLPEAQLRAGYAEVVKYGLIDDPAFFAWCEDEGAALLAGHRPALETAIAAALKAKARRVEGDLEDMSGQRALLNLGHSFAHAIESIRDFAVLHGEAVAVGLVMAHALSARLGLCPPGDAARVEQHLARHGLPTHPRDLGVDPRALLEAMRRDKKNARGRFTLVLSHGIGRAFLQPDVPEEALAAFLAAA